MLNEITNENAVEEVENSRNGENDPSVGDTTPTVDQKEIKVIDELWLSSIQKEL